MTQAVQKVCRVCGEDVADRKRTKDAQGRYYCQPCYAAASQHAVAPAVPPLPTKAASKVTASPLSKAMKGTLRWLKLFSVTLLALCLVAGVALIFAPSAQEEKHERFLKAHPETASPSLSSDLPAIHIVDKRGQVSFTNWTVRGFNLVGTMVSKGPSKIDEITYVTRRGGVVKKRGDVQVPGGYFKTGEPTEVTILCWEDPSGLDVTIEIGY